MPRRVTSEHGPKTIQQIREDYAKDFGIYFAPNVGQGSGRGSAFANLFSPPPRPGSSEAFMFAPRSGLGERCG